MAKRGRPPRPPEARASQRVILRLTPSERLALRRVAAENRTTVASVLREAANEYVADYRERVIFTRATQRLRT